MDFHNEPPTDFSLPAAQQSLIDSLRFVKSHFDHSYPNVIGNKLVYNRRTTASFNPSHPNEVVGKVPEATAEMANRALDSATRSFESWKHTDVFERASLLRRIALALRRKSEFSAWMIVEVGKSWDEADADVAEAIDFLEYYAELALQPMPFLDGRGVELRALRCLPIGPVVVLPPWNFPLAILVGMTSAALVTGNTVVVKPSGLSPIVAAKFLEVAEKEGLPAGVFNFLTGRGATVGELLVKDPRTRMVAFTGSREVGLRINALAAQTLPSQRWIKRVIAEMGGKNAIIVDQSADLEAAAKGIIASAFGFQGQKCSACSRVFAHRAIYKSLVERLHALISDIRVGPAEIQTNFMGPVISQAARLRILKAIDKGFRQCKATTAKVKRALPDDGFYVAPVLLEGLELGSPLWTQEIFGPVIAIASVSSFAAGLKRANETDFGLTGAVYSQDLGNLEKARKHFFVGNLYLNRKCTGALVGAHPFGGFNMSGTDSKAGGPDYLSLFSQTQAIAEKLPG